MTSLPPPGTDDPLIGPDLPELEPLAEVTESAAGGRRFWRAFVSDHWAVAGLVFLVVMIVAAVFAPLIAPDSPSTQDLLAINAGPGLHHWLGTDDLGRDILSRIIWGGRVSLRATFEIVDTEPQMKVQTASGSYKPALLSNGVRTMVPPYLAVGVRVVVMTADGSYVERAKD